MKQLKEALGKVLVDKKKLLGRFKTLVVKKEFTLSELQEEHHEKCREFDADHQNLVRSYKRTMRGVSKYTECKRREMEAFVFAKWEKKKCNNNMII